MPHVSTIHRRRLKEKNPEKYQEYLRKQREAAQRRIAEKKRLKEESQSQVQSQPEIEEHDAKIEFIRTNDSERKWEMRLLETIKAKPYLDELSIGRKLQQPDNNLECDQEKSSKTLHVSTIHRRRIKETDPEKYQEYLRKQREASRRRLMEQKKYKEGCHSQTEMKEYNAKTEAKRDEKRERKHCDVAKEPTSSDELNSAHSHVKDFQQPSISSLEDGLIQRWLTLKHLLPKTQTDSNVCEPTSSNSQEEGQSVDNFNHDNPSHKTSRLQQDSVWEMLQDVIELERLKAALYHGIKQISKEVEEEMEVDINSQVLASLSECLNRQVENYACDLELFARHGKRSNVNPDDVKLLVRKNPILLRHIEDLASEYTVEKEVTKKTKKTGGNAEKKGAAVNQET